MTVEKPKPPAELGVDGRRLWRDVVADVAAHGLVLDARELSWLRSAGIFEDRAAVLEAELAGALMIVRGSNSQPLANPLLAELRMTRLAAGQMLARLKLDPPESGRSRPGVNQNRAAVNASWRTGGA